MSVDYKHIIELKEAYKDCLLDGKYSQDEGSRSDGEWLDVFLEIVKQIVLEDGK